MNNPVAKWDPEKGCPFCGGTEKVPVYKGETNDTFYCKACTAEFAGPQQFPLNAYEFRGYTQVPGRKFSNLPQA